MEKRILDDATRKKLQGLLPFGKDSFAVVVPDMFLEFPEEYQPKFFMRGFDEASRKLIRDHALSGTLDKETMARALGDSALGRWENLRDSADPDKLIPYDKELLITFNDHLFMWLYYKAAEMASGPSELEKEGLESSPQPASAPVTSLVPGAGVPQS